MPTATTYSTFKQFVGIAPETSQGTPIAPTQTIPVTKFEPEDKPVTLPDKSITGSMTLAHGLQQGVIKSDFSMHGYVFADTIVPLLVNTLGDRTTTGGGSATTTTAPASAGATTIVTAANLTAGQIVNIDTGTLIETRTVISAVTSTATIAALTYAHASGATVTPLYSHAISLKNDAQGQPISHTFTHFQGVPATTFARTYAGTVIDDLALKFNAATDYFEYDVKGMCWPSAIAVSTPTSSPSAITPIPSWRAILGVGGPASGGTLNATIQDGSVNIKRKCTSIFTVQGSQNPYIIQRGELDITGKLTVVAQDESFYNAMRNNTQPQLQLVVAGGGTQITIDTQNAAYKTAKYSGTKEVIEYIVDWEGIANTTNAGASGGYSPCKVTVQNAVAGTTY